MNKFRNWLYRFMIGRYGHDKLNYFLIIFAMILSITSGLFFRGNVYVSLVVYLLLTITLIRMFSRNHYRRRKENGKFMELTRPIRSFYKQVRNNLTDRSHKYYTCPQCGQKVRVPRGRGKIEITCPSCRHRFTRRS